MSRTASENASSIVTAMISSGLVLQPSSPGVRLVLRHAKAFVDWARTTVMNAAPDADARTWTGGEFYGSLLRRGRAGGSSLSPSRVRRIHGVLRRAFTQAVKWGWVWVNPVPTASPPREPQQSCIHRRSRRSERCWSRFVVSIQSCSRSSSWERRAVRVEVNCWGCGGGRSTLRTGRWGSRGHRVQSRPRRHASVTTEPCDEAVHRPSPSARVGRVPTARFAALHGDRDARAWCAGPDGVATPRPCAGVNNAERVRPSGPGR